MIWFKINESWYIDLTQIREFGVPKDRPGTIMVTYKDGKEDFYGVNDPRETFNRLAEYVSMVFSPVLTPTMSSDEILKTMEGIPNGVV